jgi:zinc transport system substrate-binding protein
MQYRLFGAYIRCMLALGFFWPALSTSAPEVVVSITPVHSLIAGVMAGVGTPELLMRSAQTPHDINLAPSDVRKLSRADRVFWVGRALELSMAKIVRVTVDESNSVELLSAPGMELLQIRSSGLWVPSVHSEKSDDHGGLGTVASTPGNNLGHKQNVDPHIWLSPVNASRIVHLAAAELSLIDPENAEFYRRNAAAVLARIHSMDLEIGKRLSAVNDIPYIVFHDAYAYFEHHYRLNAVGSLSVSLERSPGARRIQQLRATIKLRNVRCVFSEPQFEPGLVRTLLEGSEARSGRLDPLGAGLPPGPDAYFVMMNNLAEALTGCLEPLAKREK